MRREDEVRLRHMLDAAVQARQFLEQTTLEDFAANPLPGNAVVHSLEIIGEAGAQVSKGVKQTHPEIEWAVSSPCATA